MSDRTVHATAPNRAAELVRYDRSGKWFVEYGSEAQDRERISIDNAASVAVEWERNDGKIHRGRCGGRLFDARVREVEASLVEQPEAAE